MRFRVLSDTELKTLEEDLIQFLVVNHVYGDDWAKMNTENPSQAQNLIVLFSDLVLEKVYNKVYFLEILVLGVFEYVNEVLQLSFWALPRFNFKATS